MVRMAKPEPEIVDKKKKGEERKEEKHRAAPSQPHGEWNREKEEAEENDYQEDQSVGSKKPETDRRKRGEREKKRSSDGQLAENQKCNFLNSSHDSN